MFLMQLLPKKSDLEKSYKRSTQYRNLRLTRGDMFFQCNYCKKVIKIIHIKGALNIKVHITQKRQCFFSAATNDLKKK